ncbi:MAG: hypothetical protein ACR2PH_17875, partial [Desulfobulbia bacterium]
NRTRLEINFRWINIDNPDDFFEQVWFGYGIDTSDKGPGKAISYAQRMVTLKTLHLETGEKDLEEDDVHFESGGQEEKSSTPSHPSPTKPKTQSIVHESTTPPFKDVEVDKKLAGKVYYRFQDAGFSKQETKEYLQHHYNVESNFKLMVRDAEEILEKAKEGKLVKVVADIPF